MKNEAAHTSVNETADDYIHTSVDPGVKQTLDALSQPLDPSQIKTRPGAMNKGTNQREVFAYVPWYDVAEILCEKAPDWSHTIKDIQVLAPNLVAVIVALTVKGITREGIGTGTAMTDTGIKKAEHDALKRAAVKFRVGIELYKKESDAIDRNARRYEPQEREFDFNAKPTEAAARSPQDTLTPKQLSMIKRLGKELKLDVAADCGELWQGVSLESLNKKAASWFISYLQEQQRTFAESNQNTRALNSAADGQKQTAVSPETKGRLLLEGGAVVPQADHYRVDDNIKGQICQFKVFKDGDVIACSCGDYKTRMVKGEPDYNCAHKVAARMFGDAKRQANGGH